ncbi:bacterial Ig-like domain-containing protein [Enterococcus sp. DIV0212c]|uniref:bacterial Ig-like domain-containing protein n=1 Tax=Enterococcus sp. DIV0212c TaxID=2230867 RepID=UPI001AC78641|nr:bacterial Ig-like domain-containing protein [Enterococcus sp. DIV0212c]
MFLIFGYMLEAVTVFAESTTENSEIADNKNEKSQETMDSSAVDSSTVISDPEVNSTEQQETDTYTIENSSNEQDNSSFKSSSEQAENTKQNNNSQIVPRIWPTGSGRRFPNGLMSDNEIMEGNPNLNGYREYGDDWWHVANHIFTRRIIDNYLYTQCLGKSLGYRKGDKVSIPIVKQYLDFSSGKGGKEKNNRQDGQRYAFQELVSWNLRTKSWVSTTDWSYDPIPYLAIDWSDIPRSARPDKWELNHYRSAFLVDGSNSYLEISWAKGKDSIAGTIGDSIRYEIKNITRPFNAVIEFERIKTTLTPESVNKTRLSDTIYYVSDYGGADSDYSNGSYSWWGRDGDKRDGYFKPSISINSVQPTKIEAEQDKPVDVILGESLSAADVNLNDVVKVLKRTDGTAIKIEADSYTQAFQTIGEHTVNVKVTQLLDGASQSTIVPLKVNVRWGSTVLMNGYNSNSIGAITLHQKGGSDLELTDTVGCTRESGETQVHKYFSGESYYDLRLLGVTDIVQKPKDLKPVTKENSLTWAHGEADAQARINAFGDNSDGRQKASVGNILQVTHVEAYFREYLMVNEQKTKENDDQKIVYYELTKNGFIPLRVNQLEAKKSSIPQFATEQYLNKHIKEYIDLKGYSNIEVKKFSSYPTTNKVGETSGKIVVEERLKSGKKVQEEYEVQFTVKEDKSSIKTKDITIYQGQSWKREDSFVSATDEVGKSVPFSDGRVDTNGATIDTNKPGVYELKYTFKGNRNVDSKCKVTVKEDKTKAKLKPVEIYVGNEYDPDLPFENVTDKDGKKLSAKEVNYYYIDGKETKTFKLDTSIPGEHEVKVVVRNAQPISAGVNKYWTHSNKVKVTVKEYPALTAESIEQKTILGTDTSKWDASKLIKNVKKEENKPADSKEYTTRIKEVADTKMVGTKNLIVEIKRTSNGKITDIEVPVTVKWGSTIVVDNVPYPGNSSYALTILTGDSPRIIATYGNNSDYRSSWINDYRGNKEYLRTMIYENMNSDTVLNNQKSDYQYSMTGEGMVEDAVKNFGTSGEYPVNNGDVVGQYVYTVDNNQSYPDNNRLFKDEKVTQENNGLDTVYYEVTKTGFQPLRVNQMKMKGDISTIRHISNTDLEKDLKENPDKYFENPNKYNDVKLVGFAKYPDTSKSGKQPATIRFEETLKSGKKVQYDYDIQLNVDNRWVNVTIPTKMLFFSDMKSGKKDKVISESYSITNNSDNTSLEVEMASFSVAKDSEVTYLSPTEKDPVNGENKLRLNLLVNSQPKVQGLTNETKPTHLIDLDVKKSTNLTFEGQYFNAKSEDSPEAKSSMVLKFNIKK